MSKWACSLMTLIAFGCAVEESKSGTGAREAAQAFFDALIRRDWEAAYNVLHPESQARVSRVDFKRLAPDYIHRLGFEPDNVKVRSCDERGREGVAHVVLSGKVADKSARYREAVVLRQSAGKWKAVLPTNVLRAP